MTSDHEWDAGDMGCGDLVLAGAAIVSGAKLVEFTPEGAPIVSY